MIVSESRQYRRVKVCMYVCMLPAARQQHKNACEILLSNSTNLKAKTSVVVCGPLGHCWVRLCTLPHLRGRRR